MKHQDQRINSKKSWVVYALIVLSLLFPLIYYSSHASGIIESYTRPLVRWMHGYVPLTVTASVLVIVLIVYSLRKKQILTAAKVQLMTYGGITALFFCFNPWAFSHWPELPLSITFTAAAFYLSSAFAGRLTYAIWPVVFFISLFTYALKCQGFFLGRETLAQIFTTSWNDASSYLTVINILMCVGAIVVSFLVWHYIYKFIRRENRYTLFSSGMLLLVPCLAAMLLLKSNIAVNSTYVWPLGCTQQLANDSKKAVDDIKQIKYVLSLLPESSELDASIAENASYDGVTCILHIGESVSASHLPMNGYERNTTPWLSSQERLINFKDCISSAALTDRAILTMLTNGRRCILETSDPEYLPTSPGLVDFFKKCGFKCATFWADYYVNSTSNSFFGKQIEYFNQQADKVYGFSEPNYMEQLPDIYDFIKENSGANTFLMINNNGSHVFYDGRDYQNSPFPVAETPGANMQPNENPRHAESCINAYDSTIHQTDKYISLIARQLAGKPFIYIFMSDHGEYLGEYGYWQRGQAPSYQFHEHSPCKVPFFIYASPEFENACPHFKTALEQLRANRHLCTAHEHLFHTILGIMNIKTSFHNPELDLSTPSAKPYSGPRPAENNDKP